MKAKGGGRKGSTKKDPVYNPVFDDFLDAGYNGGYDVDDRSAVAIPSVVSLKRTISTKAASVASDAPNRNRNQTPTSELTTSASTTIDSKVDSHVPSRDQTSLRVFFNFFFRNKLKKKFSNWTFLHTKYLRFCDKHMVIIELLFV